ncbi:MAG: hypothetical protein AAB459_04455 [Patescibacteria group bacterium]
MWQDKVIAACQLLFFFTMLPSILSKHKPALATSIMNCVLVTVIVFCFFTLDLWYSVATAIPASAAWFILAVQKFRLRNLPD